MVKNILIFDYFVNNEPAFHDKEIVEISFDGGSTWNQYLVKSLSSEVNKHSLC